MSNKSFLGGFLHLRNELKAIVPFFPSLPYFVVSRLFTHEINKQPQDLHSFLVYVFVNRGMSD